MVALVLQVRCWRTLPDRPPQLVGPKISRLSGDSRPGNAKRQPLPTAASLAQTLLAPVSSGTPACLCVHPQLLAWVVQSSHWINGRCWGGGVKLTAKIPAWNTLRCLRSHCTCPVRLSASIARPLLSIVPQHAAGAAQTVSVRCAKRAKKTLSSCKTSYEQRVVSAGLVTG
jgi:hypothetical protein